MTEIVSENQATENNDVRKQIIKRIDSLPSLSNVVNEFLDLSKSGIFTAKDFERVISKDQALVARLLKVANSGFYGRSRTINTITEAIVLIGMDNMKKIVYSVSSDGLLRQDFKVYSYPDMGFWLHSMGVGTVCRATLEGAEVSELGGEEIFIAGLIHDVGKLLIDDYLDAEKGLREVSLEEEIASTGIDHTELGDIILKNWSIPDAISQAVKYHHIDFSSEEHNVGSIIVGLADRICNFWGVGTEPFMDLGEDIDCEPYQTALDKLKITEPRFQEILLDVRQKLVNLEKLFESD